MKTSIIKTTLIATLFIFLAGCNELDFNLSGYNIEYPEKNKTYIGLSTQPPSINQEGTTQLQSVFKINYTKPPSNRPTILLNGHIISDYFTFGPSQATANVADFKQFLRQGSNSFVVEQMAFGPNVIFNFDGFGPAIIITQGKLNTATNNVQITGYLRDFSPVSNKMTLKISNVDGSQSNGQLNISDKMNKEIAVAADGTFDDSVDLTGFLAKPLIYQFEAKDYYGYTTKKSFLAGGQGTQALTFNNAVNVAIGDTFVQALRPLIASGVYASISEAPIDIKGAAWDDPKICKFFIKQSDAQKTTVRGVASGKAYTPTEYENARQKLIDAAADTPNPNPNPNDSAIFAEIASCSAYEVNPATCNCPASSGQDGGVFPDGLNPLPMNMGLGDWEVYLKRFFMNDGSTNKPGGNAKRQGTILLNSFELLPNNQMAVDLTITQMIVDITIDAGWFLGNIDLNMSIDSTYANVIANASAKDGKVEIKLLKDGSSFQLDGISSSETKVWGINLAFIAGPIINALSGLIGDMIPDIINPMLEQKLQQIVIGGTLTQPETQTAFDMSMNVQDLKTEAPFLDYELKVGLSSKVQVTQPDTFINPMLGPVFKNDPVNPLEINNAESGVQGTNISVAIDTNVINQSLNAAYSTGVMSFTVYNGKTYYGGNPMSPVDVNDTSKTIANKGDTRIRLWPAMPPEIDFSDMAKQGITKAYAKYDSATLSLDTLRLNASDVLEWQTDIEMNVNFDIAIGIKEEGNTFSMSAAGPPVFQINSMKNRGSIQVPKSMIQWVMDTAITIGSNALADQMIILDLGKIADQTLNGQVVQYLSANDRWTLAADECITYDDNGNEIGPNGELSPNGGDNENDLVCQTIDFHVSTDKVDAVGAQSSNLFFQMQVKDPKSPPAAAIPRFDLDDDGQEDPRDNCAFPAGDLAQLIKDNGGLAGNLDEDGKPTPTFDDAIKQAANNLLAQRYGIEKGWGTTVAGKIVPDSDTVNHYNRMRTGDSPVNSSNWGDYPWLTVLYKNASQTNQDGISPTNPDGDRIGDLCENDDDRDGIWASYDGIQVHGFANDNCPYTHNPLQENTTGLPAGDACNARITFVMLRSYQSMQDNNGIPMCLTHDALDRGGWVSDTMHTMEVCDASKVGQRWYMKSYNGTNLDAGVEFYDNDTRNSTSASRLAAYGRLHFYNSNCSGDIRDHWVEELRLVNTNNSGVMSRNNADLSMKPCNTDRSAYKADTIWYPEKALLSITSSTYDEISHPWIIKTHFGADGPLQFPKQYTNRGNGSCMAYADGTWGVDIDSDHQDYRCQNPADTKPMRYRWAIWVGGSDSPWSGEW